MYHPKKAHGHQDKIGPWQYAILISEHDVEPVRARRPFAGHVQPP
jgi:hypothetical protein